MLNGGNRSFVTSCASSICGRCTDSRSARRCGPPYTPSRQNVHSGSRSHWSPHARMPPVSRDLALSRSRQRPVSAHGDGGALDRPNAPGPGPCRPLVPLEQRTRGPMSQTPSNPRPSTAGESDPCNDQDRGSYDRGREPLPCRLRPNSSRSARPSASRCSSYQRDPTGQSSSRFDHHLAARPADRVSCVRRPARRRRARGKRLVLAVLTTGIYSGNLTVIVRQRIFVRAVCWRNRRDCTC